MPVPDLPPRPPVPPGGSRHFPHTRALEQSVDVLHGVAEDHDSRVGQLESDSGSYATKEELEAAILAEGWTYVGVWDAGTEYQPARAVDYNDVVYVSTAVTTGDQPDLGGPWTALPGGADTLARTRIGDLDGAADVPSFVGGAFVSLAGDQTVTGTKTFADVYLATAAFKHRPYADPTHPDFGAVGDGDADDSQALQDAFAASSRVHLPPGVFRSPSGLVFPANGVVTGAGKFLSVLDGRAYLGDGANTALRRMELHHLGVLGGVAIDESFDFKVDNCNVAGSIGIVESVRGTIKNSRISNAGAGPGSWAIRGAGYVNGIVIADNIITGGSTGGAINLRGPVTGGNIRGNVIESSLHGIWVSSEPETVAGDAGQSHAVNIVGNYIEQCSTPFRIAKTFTVAASVIEGNYVGNGESSVITERDAVFSLRRLRDSRIAHNVAAVLNNAEAVFDVEIAAAMEFRANTIVQNKVDNTPTDVFRLSGSGAATTSFQRALGARNSIDLLRTITAGGITYPAGESSDRPKTWLSTTLRADVTQANLAWMLGANLTLGGAVLKVEVVEVIGALTGTRLRVGDTGSIARIVDVADLSALSYTNGTADLGVTGEVFTGTNNTVSITAGSGTGTFRVKITYKAS